MPLSNNGQFSVLDVSLVLVQNRRLIAVTVALFALAGIIFALIPKEPEYISAAKVVRETDGEAQVSGSPFSALSRFGINFSGGSTGLSPQAYPEILKSREVRLGVARDTFYLAGRPRGVTLVDYVDKSSKWWGADANKEESTAGRPTAPQPALVRPPDSSGAPVVNVRPSAREERAINRVRSMMSTSVDDDTGIMTISATSADPQLSSQLVISLIEHLEQRVREIKTKKARENLEFVQSRVAEAGEELKVAEDELARFMDRNTSVQSARLRAELERRQRQVGFKAQLYTELQAQHTQAEMSLQRSNPVITIIEHPVPPRAPVERNSGIIILVAVILGMIVAVGLAFTRWYIQRQEAHEHDRQKLNEIRAAIPGVPRLLKRNS